MLWLYAGREPENPSTPVVLEADICHKPADTTGVGCIRNADLMSCALKGVYLSIGPSILELSG